MLRDIDIHIHSGETIGIIGGTGSAKSTLVSLISRLYDVDRGSVIVGGEDVRKYDLEVLRNEVAVVLQNNVLFSGTILQNLRWGNENATLEECQEACRLACADDFIQDFLISIILILNKVEQMFLVDKNNVYVLPEHC